MAEPVAEAVPAIDPEPPITPPMPSIRGHISYDLFKKLLWYLTVVKGISALSMSSTFWVWFGKVSDANSRYLNGTMQQDGRPMNMTTL
jgi:hypothetical protein